MNNVKRIGKTDKGFTLVELMVAMAVLSIVMLGILAIFQHLDKTWISEEIKADMQQNARVAMDNIVRDMMMMGHGSAGVGSDTEGKEAKVIVAGKNELEFLMWTNDPTVSTETRKQYRVKYYLSGKQLRKRYVETLASPSATHTDILIADNVKTLEFQYYFGDPNHQVMESYTSLGTRETSDQQFDYFDDCYNLDGSDMVWAEVNSSGLALDATQIERCKAYQEARNNIRRIKVLLQVETDKVIPGTEDIGADGNPIRGTAKKKVITLRADMSPKNLWETDVPTDLDPPVLPNFTSAVGEFLANEIIKVRDTETCGTLKARWRNFIDGSDANRDIEGYLVKYGVQQDFWTNYVDVPNASQYDDDNPPNAELPDCTVQKFGEPAGSAAYYVQVQAYDRTGNYSDPIVLEKADPLQSNTDFAVAGNDTAVTIPMPAAVEGFEAYTTFMAYTTAQARLAWTPSTDPNVIGYRIYRSRDPFGDGDYPLVPDGVNIVMIAKESEDDGLVVARTDKGGTSSGFTWSYHDGEFIDKSSALIGCFDYYYAICPVTCDATQIYSTGDGVLDTRTDHTGALVGIYTATQYKTGHVNPTETTPPETPEISAKAGYKRVFLNVTWPSDVDYDYTKIFFKSAALNINDEPDPIDDNLIPDRQTVDFGKGEFHDEGNSGKYTVIFNDEVEDIPAGASPNLSDGQSYTFLAVAYDKCGNESAKSAFAVTFAEICGDDPCGAPRWTDGIENARVWVDGATTRLDTSLWVSSTQVKIGLTWTPINNEDMGRALDFFGYKLSRGGAPIPEGSPKDTSGMEQLYEGLWDSNTYDQDLSEGARYYYCLQAADCIYEGVDSGVVGLDDVILCVDTGEPSKGADILANNISDCVELQGLCPGKLRQYDTDETFGKSAHEELATTRGEYHNKVLFYLQNTSAAPLRVDNIRAIWTNTNVKLASVTFGKTAYNDATTTSVNLGPDQLSTTIGKTINSVAYGPGDYSGPIPVTLNFENTGGGVSSLTDMRGQLIDVEIVFANTSMPGDNTGLEPLTGFTTGYLDERSPDHLQLAVTGGPKINLAIQDQPVTSYIPFIVPNRETDATMPAGYPKVKGKRDVEMLTNVTRPTTETVDTVEPVVIRYVETSPLATQPPLDDNFSSIDYVEVQMEALGSGYYKGTIPGPAGADGRGVWYYLLARTDQGNFARRPSAFDSFYYYEQLEFNKCNETPSAPENLHVDTESDPNGPFLTWSSVTTYEGGYSIPEGADDITYEVYRTEGIGSSGIYDLMTTVDGTSYTDWTNDFSLAFTYALKAVNSCVTPGPNKSEYSDEIFVCPTEGTECYVSLSRTFMFTGQTSILTIATCEAAGDLSTGELGSAQIKNIRDYDATGRTTYNSDSPRVVESGNSGITVPVYIRPVSDKSRASASRSDGVIYATDPSIGQMVDYLEVASSFHVFGCATSMIAVVVDPCDNTPSAPTGLTGSVAGTSHQTVTLTWDAVTTNDDEYGSPADYFDHFEHPIYEIWYEAASTGGGGENLGKTLIGTLDPYPSGGGLPVLTLNTQAPVGSASASILDSKVTARFSFTNNLSNNTDYSFYLYATDTCTDYPPNRSADSSNVYVNSRKP